MRRAIFVFTLYLCVTLALTYPLITRLANVLPSDAGDPALNTWILWWNAHALPYTSAWWDAPAFYPAGGSLAFSEHLLGLSVISSPIQWLGGTPQLAYNVVFLLSFPLCALAAYLLMRELGGRGDAAIIAGLLFGFAPYRVAHLAHIQYLAAFGMPVALLGLHRYLHTGQARCLAVFGTAWLLQSLCNGYYMFFFSVLVAMWVAWFATTPRTRGAFAAILTAWGAAALPLVPLLWKYHTIHERFGFSRDFGMVRDFGSADLVAVLNAAQSLTWWGWLHVFERPEGALFPGLTVVLLIACGWLFGRDAGVFSRAEPPIPLPGDRHKPGPMTIVRQLLLWSAIAMGLVTLSAVLLGPWRVRIFELRLFSVGNPVKPMTYVIVAVIALGLTSHRIRRMWADRSVLGFYSLAALFMWLFALGPSPTMFGTPFMYRGPYALLMLLPGFNSLRSAARFWMIAVLCIAIVGGLLFDRLARGLRRGRWIAAGVVVSGVLADGWVSPFPLTSVPTQWSIENCTDTESKQPLLELPLGDVFRDAAAMYRGMFHGRPLVNGYSGYFPPYYPALAFGLSTHEQDILTQLANLGVSDVAIDSVDDPDGGWRAYVASHQGSRSVCSGGGRTLYRLASAASPGQAQTDQALPIAAVHANVNPGDVKRMTDGDLDTRWRSGRQTDGTLIDIDLGMPRSVTGVRMMLGRLAEDFPRMLSVEISEAGSSWQEVYRGGTAAQTLAGALAAPKDVPLTIGFPRVTARYLRLRSLANDATHWWSIAELEVLGS